MGNFPNKYPQENTLLQLMLIPCKVIELTLTHYTIFTNQTTKNNLFTSKYQFKIYYIQEWGNFNSQTIK